MNYNDSLVSIIIPVFNREHLVLDTLRSIVSQTHKKWECIIVDDGSTDNTLSVIQDFIRLDNRFKFYSRPDTLIKGANSCRNFGFKQCSGFFINWFDSDDIMLPNFIEEKIKIFEPNFDFVITTGYYADRNLKIIKKVELSETNNLYKSYVLWELKVFTPSVMFKKSFLDDIDLFSLEISKGQEAEFFSRVFYNLKKINYMIVNVPTFLYREHEESSTHINKKYVFKFKESQSLFVMVNFERALILKDRVLIDRFYRSFINLLFNSLKNNHKSNVHFLIKNFKELSSKRNPTLFNFLLITIRILSITILNKVPFKYLFLKIKIRI